MFIDEDDYLEHFGRRGMHWGVRKDDAPGVSAKTNREARRDAKEHARAKLFYGEGAGTRRKLIKATVEAKSKQDPAYKKAFEHHLANQDLADHAQKARAERGRKDRSKSAKQTTSAVARRLTGEMGTKAAIVAVAATGIAFAKSPRGQRAMKTSMNKLRDFSSSTRGRSELRKAQDFIKKNM